MSRSIEFRRQSPIAGEANLCLHLLLKPVEVQAPVSHERWIPNPTIGFAFVDSADNIYFGFSHESCETRSCSGAGTGV